MLTADPVLATLLFLHIGGAIVAFGPSFTFPIIGPMAGREPQHANFALRFQEAVANRLIIPLAIVQGVTGLALVWRLSLNLLVVNWLTVAIVLYLINLAVALGLAMPNLRRFIQATSAPPPAPPPGAAPRSGPPPHIAALAQRGRQLGLIQAALLVLIVFLMVTKPF